MIDSPDEFNIPNTFLPLCNTKIFSVNYLLGLLKYGFVTLDKMPKEVAERVQKEWDRRGRIWKNTMSRSLHSEIINQKE